MPWVEHRTMDLRQEFVLRAVAPEANLAALAREFRVSRKTAYKWLKRFHAGGVDALVDMSRRPRRVVETSGEFVLRISELREAHPRWGPKKLRELLRRENPGVEVPSTRTIDRVLCRLGEARLRRPQRRRGHEDVSTPSSDAAEPNDLWTMDFKGWWLTARTRDRCEPFTVRDAASRYILELRLLPSTTMSAVRKCLTRLFQQYGLPKAMRMDNGSPFGCTRAPCGLTKLTAWLVSLGIEVHFGRPACPQDNGAHERMHRDMSASLQMRPAATRSAQQHACDAFREEFNTVRPHEALKMKTPSEVYVRSSRAFRGPRTPRYPLACVVRVVCASGTFKLRGKRYFAGSALARQSIGVETRDEHHATLWLYELRLGELDLDSGDLAPPRRTSVDEDASPVRGAVLVAESARRRANSTPEPDRRGQREKCVTPSVAATDTSTRRKSSTENRKPARQKRNVHS
jgi:putative transposase